MARVFHALNRPLAQQCRTAGGQTQIGHQRARHDAGALLGSATDPDIEGIADIAQLARCGRHSYVDVGEKRLKVSQPRQQPVQRETRRHVHADDARHALGELAMTQPRGPAGEAFKSARQVVQQRGTLIGQQDAARTTLE
jgi:hypothetical protein